MKRSATTNFRRGKDRRIADSFVALDLRRHARRVDDFRWIDLFRDTDPDELDAALAECEVLLLSAGESLLHLGAHNQSVFILLSGKLTAYLGEDANPATAIHRQER